MTNYYPKNFGKTIDILSSNWSNKTQYELLSTKKMLTKENYQETFPHHLTKILTNHYIKVMAAFYETQSSFLTEIYKRYNSIETANIILCFTRTTHLEIIRQREKNLNFDVSFDNFWNNLRKINKKSETVSSIVQYTGVPKETVRRKIQKLKDTGHLLQEKKSKGYYWNLSLKLKDSYFKSIDGEIKILSKFISKFTKYLKLNLNENIIEDEIRSQFSFYWYHFLNCQLEWLRMWQAKFKDNDLLLIILQTIIPTLKYAEKHMGSINRENIFKIIGKTNDKYDFSNAAVSATTVSEVTGIPRATCIRKLDKLVILGWLLREKKTKRYFVNQNIDDRTKNVVTKENVNTTIEIFSEFITIIINSLVHNNKIAI